MVTFSEETMYLRRVSLGQALYGKFQGPYGLQEPAVSVISSKGLEGQCTPSVFTPMNAIRGRRPRHGTFSA